MPGALLLATALLALSVLLTRSGMLALESAEIEQRRHRTEALVRLNATPLVESLGAFLRERDTASALLPTADPGTLRQVAFLPGASGEIALHSHHPTDPAPCLFRSPVSGKRLQADWRTLDSGSGSETARWAWSFEDLALAAPPGRPPGFWPLEDWFRTPLEPPFDLGRFLDQETLGTWRQGPWIPEGEPLPFRMESSPALVPVVLELSLHFGIFASGPQRNREKGVRVRYFISGRLWNPYNRPLQVHAGSRLQPAFQAAFLRLPEVRLHNPDRGMRSSWISLDDARNDLSGLTGLHGWVRLPQQLQPGEIRYFEEPDPRRQPEGLARTLHPGFPVGPGDRIDLEFRDNPFGMGVALLPLSVRDPPSAILQGQDWFRAEGFPGSLPPQTFRRADDPPRPFLLSGGSLSFRRDSCQFRIRFAWAPTVLKGIPDPRQRVVSPGTGYLGASGDWVNWGDHFQLQAGTVPTGGTVPDFERPSATPLFSWPDREPESLLAATDLPQWREGYRLGARGAARWNTLLEDPAAWPGYREALQWQHPGPGDAYLPAFPVNLLEPPAWETLLKANGPDYPAYPLPGDKADFRTWSPAGLRSASGFLAGRARHAPSRSVSGFLNRGLLEAAFPATPTADAVHPFMPVRGWLRHGGGLRGRGSAWILHLSLETGTHPGTVRRSARIWVLEVKASHGGSRPEVIRFEWTPPLDPQTH